MMRYLCCDERRRNAVAGRTDLNGISFLDVVDTPGNPLGPALTTLVVHFINAAPLPAWTAQNIAIGGGAAIRGISVVKAVMQAPIAGVLDETALVVTTDKPGDFSVYRLTLVAGAGLATPAPGFDPILGAVDFSFRASCDSDFDLVLPAPCPPATPPAPPIDYLARDFNSIFQLLADRMAVLGAPLPANDAVDLGTTLVELLAYAGDQLSYRQDAVATEATLETARQRISARRHARLVDYTMHAGCNARAFIVTTLKPGATATLGPGVQLLSLVPALTGQTVIAPGSPIYATALGQGAAVFETLGDPVALDSRLDGMRFHSWGGQACCLPRGATSATLIGALAGPGLLEPGRVLVLREMMDPATGDPALANPAHRCAVRLTSAVASSDPIGELFLNPPGTGPLAVTEIAWGVEDALPFALTISTEANPDAGVAALADISLAFGNVVLADHGLSLAQAESLGTMPAETITAIAAPRPLETVTDADMTGPCGGAGTIAVPARFNPVLAQAPLTYAAPYAPSAGESAAALLRTAPATATPAILSLTSANPDGSTTAWTAVPDLIGAEAAPLYVVEVDNLLRGNLRFGDGTNGRRPLAGATFSARYRVGNGAAGNLGAAALCTIVWTGDAIAQIENPMPAVGGTEAESIEEVRRHAPAAFRAQQLRAVTPNDYADQAKLFPGVQRAAATVRWTGSWYTHFIAVDRIGGQDIDSPFTAGLATALDRIRLAGHDLQIVDPIDVGIELALTVQVQSGFFRGAVRQALLDVLTSAPGGMFDPDRFTFGQAFYLSPILAAAQSVAGVAGVQVTTFQRFGKPGSDAIAAGTLPMAASEIARLDNDPNFPDRGVMRLSLAGGR